MSTRARIARYGRVHALGVLLAALLLVGADRSAGPAALMSDSAKLFLDALNRVQRSRTVFDFEAEHRMEWHFFPESSFTEEYGYARNGITYKEMDPDQAHLANALLASGLSGRGFLKAASVMSLEKVVGILEGDQIGHRDAEKYHFTIFGKPGRDGRWGWRVEGHHLSLHYTVLDGEVVASSPTFFGANPHQVPQGPQEGLRVLAKEEDLASALLRALDGQQRERAIFSDVAPYDIVTMASRRARLEEGPQGLPASQMSEAQYQLLLGLVAEYAHNLPPELAAQRLEAARSAPRDRVFFGWAGRTDRDPPAAVPIGTALSGDREPRGNYYRVQGPSFLIEYDNTQNQSNHSHSVWRDFENDFGLDVLARHHQAYDHRPGGGHVVAAR